MTEEAEEEGAAAAAAEDEAEDENEDLEARGAKGTVAVPRAALGRSP